LPSKKKKPKGRKRYEKTRRSLKIGPGRFSRDPLIYPLEGEKSAGWYPRRGTQGLVERTYPPIREKRMIERRVRYDEAFIM